MPHITTDATDMAVTEGGDMGGWMAPGVELGPTKNVLGVPGEAFEKVALRERPSMDECQKLKK